MKRWFETGGAGLLLISMLIGCSAADGGKQELVQMKMASWSQPIAEQSNLYLAVEKGWFDENGIQFEYVPGAGGGEAVKNILTGQADIAFANLEAVLLAADQGERLKIIYNIYPENIFNLVSLKDSNIQSITDLKGKKVGVYSLSSGTYQNLLMMLNNSGMSEQDVEIVATGVLNFGPLMEGQVAATAATDTGLHDAQQKGLGEVNVLYAKDSLNTPSDVFVVTESTFKEKKDALKRFLQTYRRSVEYTLEHPEEAAEAAVATAIDGQDKDRNLEIIKIRNGTSTQGAVEGKPLGWLDVELLKQVETAYVEMGLIQNSVQMESMVTNELVEQLD